MDKIENCGCYKKECQIENIGYMEPCEATKPDWGMTDLDYLPVAMAYVPYEKWQSLYEPDVGFHQGTLFCELDKPFLGREAALYVR